MIMPFCVTSDYGKSIIVGRNIVSGLTLLFSWVVGCQWQCFDISVWCSFYALCSLASIHSFAVGDVLEKKDFAFLFLFF